MALLMLLVFYGNVSGQNGNFRVPLNGGSIACVFNDTNCALAGSYHTGIDYHATSGNTDILASNAGQIVVIQSNNGSDHGFGNAVIIKHNAYDPQGNPLTLYTQYGHLSSLISGLYVGENVVKGQKLGVMGSTGYGQTYYWGAIPHLHFEIKYSGVLNNPSGSGQYWGYTPANAVNYGYIDPAWAIASLPAVNSNEFAYWGFGGTNNFEGWSLINIEAGSVNSGILFDDPQATDPQIHSPDIYVDASVLKYAKFRMASNGLDSDGTVYFRTNSENYYTEDKKVTFSVSNCALCGNASFFNYSIYMGAQPKWTGKITGLRIDPTTTGANGTNSDSIGIDWITLSQTP